MRTGPLFAANYNAKKSIVVNQGGTSSGKTIAILQVLFTLAMSKRETRITVVGQDVPNLKKGAYRDAKNIYYNDSVLQQWFGKPNETDRRFDCINRSFIEFTSYADFQDAKSGKRDYLFINEADGIPYNVFLELYLRTTFRSFIDYNPTSRFWVHEQLIGKDNVQVIISDHRHNPFLSEDQHNKIEGIEDKQLFRVYARGLTGVLEGLVFKNWQIVDKMPEYYKREYFGLDFGFTNDPSVLIRVLVSEGELWCDEIIADTRLLNKDIYNQAVENGVTSYSDIIADSAEPKSIAELNSYGLTVDGALKGEDSIRSGINILKGYKINITRRSGLMRSEFSKYRWMKSKSGIWLNKPIDMFNHSIDALRYVALNRLAPQPEHTEAEYYGL